VANTAITTANSVKTVSGGTLISAAATTNPLGTSMKRESRFFLLQQQSKPPEVQVAHASLASLTSQELQRTLGLKLDDLQAQGIIQAIQQHQSQQQTITRAHIKIDEMGNANLQAIPTSVAQVYTDNLD